VEKTLIQGLSLAPLTILFLEPPYTTPLLGDPLPGSAATDSATKVWKVEEGWRRRWSGGAFPLAPLTILFFRAPIYDPTFWVILCRAARQRISHKVGRAEEGVEKTLVGGAFPLPHSLSYFSEPPFTTPSWVILCRAGGNGSATRCGRTRKGWRRRWYGGAFPLPHSLSYF